MFARKTILFNQSTRKEPTMIIICNIPLDLVKPNPYQTRFVEPDSVRELADDILANGLLQIPTGRLCHAGKPVMYQQINQVAVEQALADGATVELAFGHRRLSAFRMLASEPANEHDFAAMPVHIDVLDDRSMAIKAWNENEQRLAHTPVERARAIRHFTEAFGWSQAEIADLLHLSRPVISNSLRLLELPDDIQDAMQDNRLSERQGVALLSLYSLPEKLRETAEKGWSANARPTEIVKQALAGASSDYLRTKVDELIDLYARVITWSVDHEFYEHGPRSIRCVDCDQHISKGRQVCLDSICFEIKQRLWEQSRRAQSQSADAVESQGSRPDSRPFQAVDDAFKAQEPQMPADPRYAHTPAEVPEPDTDNDGPESSPASPAPATEAAAPLTWEQSTIAVTVTWLPADGNPNGRQVMVAIRANQGIPAMRLCRENEIYFDGPVGEMLLDLKSKF
ncbi:MAG: ParB/RepB/Spo0J family partition protein [Desulforudis sp.]|nr:MAG: ParB/RepB/Spo0J family partition protein [Desulforudis sp.]